MLSCKQQYYGVHLYMCNTMHQQHSQQLLLSPVSCKRWLLLLLLLLRFEAQVIPLTECAEWQDSPRGQ
jgi:hypothetical protein